MAKFGLFLFIFVASLVATASDTILVNFNGSGNGDYPLWGLTPGPSNTFYGITAGGGPGGYGEVFQVTESGSLTVIYDGFALSGSVGDDPQSPVLVGASGDLYGTTFFSNGETTGVLYKLHNTGGTWTETVLHTFGGTGDGAQPDGPLYMDSSGNIFGTTEYGGSSDNGTVWEYSASGTYSVIYSFTGGTDGSVPYSGIIGLPNADGSSVSYAGTAASGGGSGYGTVFKLTYNVGTATWSFSVLHTFTGSPDGAIPSGGLYLDTSGNLFGTTFGGGDAYDNGTVYELSGSTETIIYRFNGTNGENPEGNPVADSSGNLYGTTFNGGSSGNGVVFELTPSGSSWTESYYSFSGYPSDGSNPTAQVTLVGNTLYGLTSTGGSPGYGTMFSISH
jgi:uncharacterized repeat protein (TIGR03803 family)